MPQPIDVTFVAGSKGDWRVDGLTAIAGAALPVAERLQAHEGSRVVPGSLSCWVLRGVTSNARYTNRPEISELGAIQAGLYRPEATRAALIPIRKTAAWWEMAQDERRTIFEEQSRHIRIGLDYRPAVARRLHHSRELGEPFDFLTWFEFAPEHTASFNQMLERLRRTPEWGYIDREVDIRLSR